MNQHIIWLDEDFENAPLIPSEGHLSLTYIMDYDLNALQTPEEKTGLLNTAHAKNYVLYFEHDRLNECQTNRKRCAGRCGFCVGRLGLIKI